MTPDFSQREGPFRRGDRLRMGADAVGLFLVGGGAGMVYGRDRRKKSGGTGDFGAKARRVDGWGGILVTECGDEDAGDWRADARLVFYRRKRRERSRGGRRTGTHFGLRGRDVGRKARPTWEGHPSSSGRGLGREAGWGFFAEGNEANGAGGDDALELILD